MGTKSGWMQTINHSDLHTQIKPVISSSTPYLTALRTALNECKLIAQILLMHTNGVRQDVLPTSLGTTLTLYTFQQLTLKYDQRLPLVIQNNFFFFIKQLNFLTDDKVDRKSST